MGNERLYTIDGKKLPSVTTILGILNKPALLPWAAKETAAEFARLLMELPMVHADGERMLPDERIMEYAEVAKKAYRKKSEEAMSKGTIVHDIIEQWIINDGKITPDEVSDPVARQGLEQFLAWGEQHEIEILESEQVITDGELYAGRYDLLCVVDGKKTLADLKTSSGIWPEYIYQCHAYAYCVPGVEQVGILRLDKETGEIEWRCWDYDHNITQAFLHLAKAWHIMKGVKV